MIPTVQATYLLDEIQEVLGGQSYGHYLAVCCPFHGDHSPSMMVYPDTYSCKSCGAFGRTENLLSRLNKSGFEPSYNFQQVEPVFNPFHRWLKTESLPKVLRRAWVNADLNPNQMDYLISVRGIPGHECRRLGIGVLGEFFTFPVLNDKRQVVGGFARSNLGVGTRYFVPKDQNPNLIYSPDWERVYDSRVVFMTFGAIDSISVHLLGFACMSTLSGKNLDVTALDFLRKRIVLIPDHGEEIEANRMAAKLDWRGAVCHFPYPYGTKDMNNVYRYNPELIKNTLESYIDGYNMASGNRDRVRSYHQQSII